MLREQSNASNSTAPAPQLVTLICCAARDATYFTKVGNPIQHEGVILQQLAVDNSLSASVLGARYRGIVPSLQAQPE